MRPADPRGRAASGRIVKLLVGRGQGFIRLADDREIFFHRSDVGDGISFNDFIVGDPVDFEIVEDPVSGARALRVRPCNAAR
jgi:cold shock CspA family protein